MRRNLFICLLLAGITLAIYWPVRHYGIIDYDDPFYLTENAMIKSGLNGHSLWWALSGIVAANWHPVTSLSFVLDNQWFGVNPGAEHVVNVLFHAANAVLLFLVLQHITGFPWRSAVVAAVFAWHPLRVESVAWISERKDVLSVFFMMLTLWAYARYAQNKKTLNPQPSTLNYTMALVFFALGLMSKPMLVTLPFVLLLLDVWPLGRVRIADCGLRSQKNSISQLPGATKRNEGGSTPWRDEAKRRRFNHLLFEKWPFFLLSAVFSGLTFWIQKNHAAMVELDKLGLGDRISNAISSYLQYLAKLFWPTKLAVFYPHPKNYDTLEVWLTALLLLAISALCIGQLFRRPYLAVGWFWYLGTAFPIIGLVQVGIQAMADRYTYIPLIGPVISLVWLAAEGSKTVFARKFVFLPATIILLAACAVLARQQVQLWKNTGCLFEHTVAVTVDNPSAQYCLAVGLEHEGRLSEAMLHYRIQAAISPLDYRAHYSLAQVLEQQGHRKQAAAEYNATVVMGANPDDYIAHLNFADALSHLGRTPEAAAQLNEALRIKPDSAEAMNNLAWTLATSPDANVRDGRQAIQLAERACALTDFKQTIFVGTLAAAYAEAGRFDDAIATAQQACDLAAQSGKPDLLKKNQKLLELYRAHKPYRE